MRSLSDPEKINSAKCNDLMDENFKRIEPKTVVDTDYIDLPRFSVEYFTRRLRQPLVTFDDSKEDYSDTGSPVSLETLESDLKSIGDKFPEKHDVNKADTFDRGKPISRIKVERGSNTAENGESKSADRRKSYYKKSSKSVDLLKHHAEKTREDMKCSDEDLCCNPRRFEDRYKATTGSTSWKSESSSPLGLANIGKETINFVPYRGKGSRECPVLLETGDENAKYSMKYESGKLSQAPKVSYNNIKKPSVNTKVKGEKIFHIASKGENRGTGTTGHIKHNFPDVLQNDGERMTDYSNCRERKSIYPLKVSQKNLKITRLEGGGSMPSKGGLSESYQKLNVGEKHKVGFRKEKTSPEPVGKCPAANEKIPRMNYLSDSDQSASQGREKDSGCRGSQDKGGKTESQYTSRDLPKVDDGFVDFMSSLGNDMDDDDLLSWCNDLMSPTIPVRKSSSLSTTRDSAADKVGNPRLWKGAKRRLEITEDKFTIELSSDTNTLVRDRSITSSCPTSKPKNNVLENPLSECPICLEPFHSGYGEILYCWTFIMDNFMVSSGI